MTGTLALAPSVLKHAKNQFDAAKSSNGFDDFLKHLTEPDSSVALPLETDLSHSIAHYFISSSHNTYLTGNQLWSRSSTGSYKEVLKQGCIEIDVWDGGTPDSSEADEPERRNSSGVKSFVKKQLGRLRSRSRSGSEKPLQEDCVDLSAGETLMPTPWRTNSNREEPRVLHGYTATKEVSFRKVCDIVREYAFRASDLPLIVSLEVHCSAAQQEIMVEIMTDYWGENLVRTPDELDDSTKLPTLGTLKKKILIKVKYSPPKGEKQVSKSGEDPQSSGDETPADAVKRGHIIEELSKMGIWTRSCHFRSLEQPEAKLATHVFALSESKLLALREEQPDALFRHNLDYLMRAYPKGTRLRSSNLDPAPLWRVGIQMVALNMQTINAATMLNFAMFDGSGGWVLKPAGCRPINGQLPTMRRYTLDLTIKVLAGQGIGLDQDTPHAYIKCELHIESKTEREKKQIPNGAKTKGGEWKRQSRVVHSRDPDFAGPDCGGDVLDFRAVKDVVPELSFVSLSRVVSHENPADPHCLDQVRVFLCCKFVLREATDPFALSSRLCLYTDNLGADCAVEGSALCFSMPL